MVSMIIINMCLVGEKCRLLILRGVLVYAPSTLYVAIQPHSWFEDK